MPDPLPAPRFDAHYYAHDCGIPYERNDHWTAFFGGIADAIVEQLQPRTVLDVGCAMGFLVEALRDRGVDAWGIDVSEHAISQAHESIKTVTAVSSAADELPANFPDHFELVTTIEVIEHMPKELALPAVRRMAGWADRVLFSSSPRDYTEATHINVQPPWSWAGLFASAGMLRSFEADASFLTPWAIVYEHSPLIPTEIVRRYESALAERVIEVAEVRASILQMQARLQAVEDAAGEPIGSAELSSAHQRAASAETELARAHAKIAELSIHYEAAIIDRARAWARLAELGHSPEAPQDNQIVDRI